MTGRSIRSRAPVASSPEVRTVMVANYGGNTSPERLLRSALFGLGLRFRRDARPIPTLRCEADIVFRGRRVCVFVDGCFWHGCPKHFVCPKTNAAWWAEKIRDNRARDRRQTRRLRRTGWKVIRVWEHALIGPKITSVTDRIQNVLTQECLPHTRR
jgi:DNA mismatch endonuclease (patch repair protein)